jgi:RHS repeat-associated protein
VPGRRTRARLTRALSLWLALLLLVGPAQLDAYLTARQLNGGPSLFLELLDTLLFPSKCYGAEIDSFSQVHQLRPKPEEAPRRSHSADVSGEDPKNRAASRAVHALVWVFGIGLDEPVRVTKDPQKKSATSYYFCQNAIGSVVALTDVNGNIVETYKYEAFGKEQIYNPDGTTRSGSVISNAIRFQGRWRDQAEGSPHYFFRGRYYDPTTGRFASRDPIGVWGDGGQFGNGYGAFGNNGVNHFDPMGFDSEWTLVNWWNDSVKPVLQAVADVVSNGPAQAFVNGAGEAFTQGNAIQQSYNNEQQHLDNTAELFGAQSGSGAAAMANTAGSFVTDVTGTSNIYQAATGNNLTAFVATGNYSPMSSDERIMSGISGGTQFVGAVLMASPSDGGGGGGGGGNTTVLYHGTDVVYGEAIEGGIVPNPVNVDSPNFNMTISATRAAEYAEAAAADTGNLPAVVRIELAEEDYLDLFNQGLIQNALGNANVVLTPEGMPAFNAASTRTSCPLRANPNTQAGGLAGPATLGSQDQR